MGATPHQATKRDNQGIFIGNDTLSAASILKASSIVNNGTIRLIGNGPIHATLSSVGAITNDGQIDLYDDTDKLAGPISGGGSLLLFEASTLEFGAGVSSGETVTFESGLPDKLVLDQAASFVGTIDDFFTRGDSVVAKTFAEAFTLLTYAQTGADSCSWTLTDGAKRAVLNFAGEPYTKSDFAIVSANDGAGLAIKFV